MKNFRIGNKLAALFVAILGLGLMAPNAQAQATRTWVSGIGDDVNPCSRTAPCKTLAGAISKTAAGGEIDAIDPAGYGTVTITKSMTIDGNGTHLSLLSSGTNGVNINAGAYDVVTLRNLSINGASTGNIGIRIVRAGTVIIENCRIFGFRAGSGRGISDERAEGGRLYVTDSTIENNLGSGIVVLPSSGAPVISGYINRTHVRDNSNSGIVVMNGGRVTVSNSIVSGNAVHGFSVQALTGTAQLTVTDSESSNNGNGVVTYSGGTLRLSNVRIMHNANGVNYVAGAIFTAGNNLIEANNSLNTFAFTGAYGLQ